MYSDSKKIQLIEEVLKLDNEAVFKEPETVLRKSKEKIQREDPKRRSSLYSNKNFLLNLKNL